MFNNNLLTIPLMIGILLAITSLLLPETAVTSAEEEQSGWTRDFNHRIIERHFYSTYFRDLQNKSDLIIRPRFNIGGFQRYEIYHPQLHLPGSRFLPSLGSLKEPFLIVQDYIPFEQYYNLYEQYYLDDIHLFSLTSYDRIKFNMRALSRGGYFLKLSLPFHRTHNENSNGRR